MHYYNTKLTFHKNGECTVAKYNKYRSIRTREEEKVSRGRRYVQDSFDFEKEKEEEIKNLIRLINLEESRENEEEKDIVYLKNLKGMLGRIIDKEIIHKDIEEVRLEKNLKRYENWLKNCNRSSYKIVDLVKNNLDEKNYKNTVFITLTFESEIEDISKANTEFTNFIKRLNRYIQKEKEDKTFKLKYICVPEIQMKRAEKTGKYIWHYHYISFNQPYIPVEKFIDLWGLGSLKMDCIYKIKKNNKNNNGEKIIENLEHFTNYICKYIRKNVSETTALDEEQTLLDRYLQDENYWLYEILGLNGKKKFFASRNLNKPKHIYLNHTDLEELEKKSELLFDKKINIKDEKTDKTIDTLIYEKRKIKEKSTQLEIECKLNNLYEYRLKNFNKLHAHYNIKSQESKLKLLCKKYKIDTKIPKQQMIQLAIRCKNYRKIYQRNIKKRQYEYYKMLEKRENYSLYKEDLEVSKYYVDGQAI